MDKPKRAYKGAAPKKLFIVFVGMLSISGSGENTEERKKQKNLVDSKVSVHFP
jgi:hypothetical protein